MDTVYNTPTPPNKLVPWYGTVSETSIQAVPINAAGTRRSIKFHNPNKSGYLAFCQAINPNPFPAAMAAQIGQGILVFPGSYSDPFDSNDQGAWNVVGDSSSLGFTVYEITS